MEQSKFEPTKDRCKEFLNKILIMADKEMNLHPAEFIVYVLNLLGHTYMSNNLPPSSLKIALDELYDSYVERYDELERQKFTNN